jgi:hypothetical protein
MWSPPIIQFDGSEEPIIGSKAMGTWRLRLIPVHWSQCVKLHSKDTVECRSVKQAGNFRFI